MRSLVGVENLGRRFFQTRAIAREKQKGLTVLGLLWTCKFILGIVLFYAQVAVHELGHFIVAKELGLRPERMWFGSGGELFRFKLLGVPVIVGNDYFGGFVQFNPDRSRDTNIRQALTALAGPFTNLLVMVLCVYYARYALADALPSLGAVTYTVTRIGTFAALAAASVHLFNAAVTRLPERIRKLKITRFLRRLPERFYFVLVILSGGVDGADTIPHILVAVAWFSAFLAFYNLFPHDKNDGAFFINSLSKLAGEKEKSTRVARIGMVVQRAALAGIALTLFFFV